MTADDLRAIMTYLMERVQLSGEGDGDDCRIVFETPTAEEMISAGLDSEGSGRLLAVEWWAEMVEDIVETPEMCDPEDSPEEVLGYARDVIAEYIRKRFPLEG
jgi:hypothetical protein